MLTTGTSNNNLLSLQQLTDFIQDKEKFKSEIESAVKTYLNDAKTLQQLYVDDEDNLFLSSLGYIVIGFNFKTQKVVVQIAEINQDNLTGFNPIEKYQQDFNPYEDALFFLDIKSNNPVRRLLQKDEITEEKCIQLLTNRIKKLIQTQVNELNLHSPYWGLAKNTYYLMCSAQSLLIKLPIAQLTLPINLFSVNDLEQYFEYIAEHRGFQSDVIKITADFKEYPERQALFNKIDEIDGLQLTATSKRFSLSHWKKYLEKPDEITHLYSWNVKKMIKTLFENGWTLKQVLSLSEKAEDSDTVRRDLLNAINLDEYQVLETKDALSYWASHDNVGFNEHNYLIDLADIQRTLKANVSDYLYNDAMKYFDHFSFTFKDKSQITKDNETYEYKHSWEQYKWVAVLTKENKEKFLENN